MPEFVTIATFTLPHEAAVPKALLESEGFRCYLLNESTLEVNPFYSNAIGGVQLQVLAEDEDRARELLRVSGFSEKPAMEKSQLLEDDPEPWKNAPGAEENSAALERHEQRPRSLLWKGFGIVLLIAALGSAGVFLFTRPKEPAKPDFNEQLTQHHWYLQEMTKTGTIRMKNQLVTDLLPKTTTTASFKASGQELIFQPEGKLVFSSTSSAGLWSIRNDTIVIGGFHDQEIFAGKYGLSLINDHNIALVTDTTSIFLVQK